MHRWIKGVPLLHVALTTRLGEFISKMHASFFGYISWTIMREYVLTSRSVRTTSRSSVVGVYSVGFQSMTAQPPAEIAVLCSWLEFWRRHELRNLLSFPGTWARRRLVSEIMRGI